MKNLLVGLLALGSLSAFADGYTCNVAKYAADGVVQTSFTLPRPNKPTLFKTKKSDVVLAWADPNSGTKKRITIYVIPEESDLIDQHGTLNFNLAEHVASVQIGGDYMEGQKSFWFHTTSRLNGEKIQLEVSCYTGNGL